MTLIDTLSTARSLRMNCHRKWTFPLFPWGEFCKSETRESWTVIVHIAFACMIGRWCLPDSIRNTSNKTLLQSTNMCSLFQSSACSMNSIPGSFLLRLHYPYIICPCLSQTQTGKTLLLNAFQLHEVDSGSQESGVALGAPKNRRHLYIVSG